MFQRNVNTFYDRLELNADATNDEIKKSFHRLAKKYHPDKNHDATTDASDFRAIYEAYFVLSDPEKRKIHDAELLKDNHFQERKFVYSEGFEDWFASKACFNDFVTAVFEEMAAISSYLKLKPTDGQNFFVVGNPIIIKNQPSFLNYLSMTPSGDLIRKSIDENEFIDSLPKSGIVKLFLFENDALMYADSLGRGHLYKRESYSHPAIFEVTFHGDINSLVMKKEFVTTSKQFPNHSTMSSTSGKLIIFTETNIDNLKLVTANLLVDISPGNMRIQFPTIDFLRLEYSGIVQKGSILGN